MRKTVSEYIDVDVDIDHDDVMDYIASYASDGELDEIRELVMVPEKMVRITLVDQMKNELLIKASRKFTLEELERKLGMTYMD